MGEDSDDRHPGTRGERRPGHPLESARSGPLRTAAAIVAVLSVAAAAALGTALVGTGPAVADRVLLGEAIDARSDSLTALAVAITNLGSTAAMGVLAGVVGLWLLRARRVREALFVWITAAGASLLFTLLKRLFDRDRPPLVDRLVGVGNESLPSGHATMAVAVIGSLVVLLWAGRGRATRIALVLAAAAWATAVGLTRIYLGVHWFSDVIAGWLVGGAWLALCATVSIALAHRRSARQRS